MQISLFLKTSCIYILVFTSLSTAQWHQEATVPTDGGISGYSYYGGMAYNTHRNVVILYKPTETWEWNGIGWKLLSRQGPEKLRGDSIVYDEKRQIIVACDYTATWGWNGKSWKKIGDPLPSTGVDLRLIYNSGNDTILTYGSLTDEVDPNAEREIWEWNGSRWGKVFTKNPPPNPANAAYDWVYDRKRNKVVMFSSLWSKQGQTWELAGNTWKNVSNSGPEPRRYHSMVYDMERSVVVLTGGSLLNFQQQYRSSNIWEWNGNSWSRTSPVEDLSRDYWNRTPVVYNAAEKQVMFFKGPEYIRTWDGSEWKENNILWPRNFTPGNQIAYHQARDQIVTLQYYEDWNDGNYHGITWIWTGNRWQKHDGASPPPRLHSAMTYDSHNKRIISFGGEPETIFPPVKNPWQEEDYRATWAWNGRKWKKLANKGPYNRDDHAIVYDPDRKVVVLFGGRDNVSGDILGDTWEFDGKEWIQVDNHGGPSPRIRHAMVYDEKRKLVVLFGGETSSYFEDGIWYPPSDQNDIWTWNGEKWKKRPLNYPRPPLRDSHGMVYDRIKEKILLFGGDLSGGGFGTDTWELNTRNWSWQQLITTIQPISQRYFMAYDSRRNRSVAFNGNLWFFSPYKPLYCHASDYDGNGQSDIAIFNTSKGVWDIKGVSALKFGRGSDIPVPGDYNGNGQSTFAYFRPEKSIWKIRGGVSVKGFGKVGDIPVPGDYDGDGKTDLAIYSPKSSVWTVHNGIEKRLGNAGDVPVPGDYDGDGTTDMAVFDPRAGRWSIEGFVKDIKFGQFGDIPVPADYDGDGSDDIAVFRPSERTWYIRGGETVFYGRFGDIPVPGDFDGDGKAEIALYRPSTGEWIIQGKQRIVHGTPGDLPLVN